MIDAYAEKLRQWLETRFAVNVPLVEAAPPAGQSAIVLGGYLAGDLYQGGTSNERLALVGFTRPDTGAPLTISLEFAIHEESGMVDRWQSSVSGALESERDSLVALLAPTARLRMSFNDSMTPSSTFNGGSVAVP